MEDEAILDAILQHDVDVLEPWVAEMDDETLFLWLNKVWDFHAILTLEALERKGMT